MLQRYKKIAHLQVFYLLNVRLFYLDAIRGLFQCPRHCQLLFYCLYGSFHSRSELTNIPHAAKISSPRLLRIVVEIPLEVK